MLRLSCSKPPLQQLLRTKQCQHFATEVTQFHSAVTLSKGEAIPVNLSVILLQHLICSQPPRGPHMTVWRLWAQMQRGNISVGSKPPPHPQKWDFSWKLYLSWNYLFFSRNLRETLNPQLTSLSCGIWDRLCPLKERIWSYLLLEEKFNTLENMFSCLLANN